VAYTISRAFLPIEAVRLMPGGPFIAAFGVILLTQGLSVPWAEVFVWPTLAQIASNMMSGSVTGLSSYLVAGLNASFLFFGIGLILFGVAALGWHALRTATSSTSS
jgi:hypothetical protein